MRKITILNVSIFVLNILVLFFLIFKINSDDDSRNDIWNKTNDCVFEVLVYREERIYGYATCFAIGEDGFLLTNKHVVNENETDIFIRINEESYKAQIEAVSEDYDMAILHIDYEFKNYLNIIDYRSKIGDEVFTIGNPNGIGLIFQQGIISGSKKNLLIDGENYLVIETTLDLNEGNSGGPLLDKDGNVIGIISFRMKDKNGNILDSLSFCCSSDEIKEFVNEYIVS